MMTPGYKRGKEIELSYKVNKERTLTYFNYLGCRARCIKWVLCTMNVNIF